MKRAFVIVAAVAFLGLLFAKPLDFISHYSEHATHAAHAINTDRDVPADRHILAEFERASSDTGHLGMGAWLIIVTVLGVGTVVGLTSLRKKQAERKNRKRGLT